MRRRFVVDASGHSTREEKVYSAAVLDVHSRRIVGCSIVHHLRSELMVDAIERERWRRRPLAGQAIVYLDRGL